MTHQFYGQDRRAEHIPGPAGAAHATTSRSAVVVGGGIAGLAAAMGLAERGVQVHLVEPHQELGGRVRAWTVNNPAGDVTMSRGFHAFFRQYYNLRSLLARAGPLKSLLMPVADYPVISVSGDRDSFAKIPRHPPLNFATFIAKSPTFSVKDLRNVDLDQALSLLDVDFPRTFSELDGISAAQFLDNLRFPARARHLALEVFARSFFADPRDFSAGELVAMFHAYFLGSAEGLLFDVPRDDFNTTLWQPLGQVLANQGVVRHVAGARHISRSGEQWQVRLTTGAPILADAVVLAAGPAATPQLIAHSPDLHDPDWNARISDIQLAPPFAVLRLWTDRAVAAERPPFLGTAGFGLLDNISVLERFETGARRWAQRTGGSVLELHAYAVAPGTEPAQLRAQLLAEMERVYPETASMAYLAEEYLLEQDCVLVDTSPWVQRPQVTTPFHQVVLAGDWVRCDLPVALMERAATTGWQAANELLQGWNIAGHDLWSVPTTARQAWPGALRRLIARQQRRQKVR